MRIIFAGTPEFAAVSLEDLAKNHAILAAVCKPSKPVGRSSRLVSPPVKKTAEKLSIPVIQPEKIGDAAAGFETLKPDAVCVAAYGEMIPAEMLKSPARPFINLHASLLPRYRGAAPIQRALMAGEKKTGVTTMLINEKLDSGDILLQKEIAIRNDENAAGLTRRAAKIGAKLLAETLDKIENGKIEPRSQDDSAATYAPMLKKSDGEIDWQKPAEDINNLVRGAFPWPGAFTKLGGKTLKILRSQTSDACGEPGEILSRRKKFVVAAGSGALEIKELQLEGAKPMPAEFFLIGAKLRPGQKLG